jgi:hypothetical protein
MRRLALLAASASLAALVTGYAPVATSAPSPQATSKPKPTPAPSPRPGGGIRGHVKPFDGATGSESSSTRPTPTPTPTPHAGHPH